MKKILAVLSVLIFLAGCSRDHDDLLDDMDLPKVEDVTFAVDGESEETFTYAQTREFNVTSSGVENVSISKPDGWEVSFENNKLTIISPHMANATAERNGQISIVAAGKNGTSTANIKVNIFNSYTITFEGNDWAPLVAEAYNGGKWTGEVDPNGKNVYTWVDDVTQLTTVRPPGWGYNWIISSYNSKNNVKYGDYLNDLYVFNPNNENSTSGGGNKGSDNFLVNFGYMEEAHPEYGDGRPQFAFKDGVPRTIKSVFVNSTCYFLNVAANGNFLSPELKEGEDVILTAFGYDANGNETGTVSMTYATKDKLITEWTKWDLSSLGEVISLKINMTGGTDNGYGFSLPAYYAVDDITIEW